MYVLEQTSEKEFTPVKPIWVIGGVDYITSRKHLRTEVNPDLHLTYSKNRENLGLVLKR